MIEITLENITKIFGQGASRVTAVDDVTLTVERGELYFLLGPSGCGKTTLLRIVAGLTEPTRGRVLFAGKDVTDQPVERRNTAMVFQNYALWPHMSVDQNVQFGPKMKGRPRQARRDLARAQLRRVQMDAYAPRRPNQLSGGQQQRVALARALAAEADALLLDEPLSNLDARLRMHMRTELRRLVKETNTTAMYVTHDQKEALSMADRIAVMDAGRIAQVGTAQELYNRPASRFVADFLGEANFLDGRCLDTGPPARVQTPAGTILAAEAGAIEAQADVTCCVRPERIALRAGTSSQEHQPNAIPGTIESSTYLGEICQYACRLDRGPLWKVSVLGQAGAPLSSGTEVQLSFAPEDVALLTG